MRVSKSGNAYGNSQEISGGGHEHNYQAHSWAFRNTGSDWMTGVDSGGTSWSTTGGGGHSHTFTPSVSDNISVSLSSNDSETRPINFTIKIWKRIL